MNFFIPISAFRLAISLLTLIVCAFVTWKWWPNPEDATGWERGLYRFALFSLVTRCTLFLLFEMLGLFPLPE